MNKCLTSSPIKFLRKVISYGKGERVGQTQEFYVIDRSPVFEYEYLQNGQDLVAEDSGFTDCLAYEQPWGRFKAFGGREFVIKLKNGKEIKADGQYWSSGRPGWERIAAATLDELTNCYVFNGYMATNELINSIPRDIPVAEYWEYKRAIQYSKELKFKYLQK